MLGSCKNSYWFSYNNNKCLKQYTYIFYIRIVKSFVCWFSVRKKKVFLVSDSPPASGLTKLSLFFFDRQLSWAWGFGRVIGKCGRNCHFAISEWHVSSPCHATPPHYAGKSVHVQIAKVPWHWPLRVTLVNSCASALQGKWCLHFQTNKSTAVRTFGRRTYSFRVEC